MLRQLNSKKTNFMNQFYPHNTLNSSRCRGPITGSTGDVRLSCGAFLIEMFEGMRETEFDQGLVHEFGQEFGQLFKKWSLGSDETGAFNKTVHNTSHNLDTRRAAANIKTDNRTVDPTAYNLITT